MFRTPSPQAFPNESELPSYDDITRQSLTLVHCTQASEAQHRCTRLNFRREGEEADDVP
jgi:hypothetical protein